MNVGDIKNSNVSGVNCNNNTFSNVNYNDYERNKDKEKYPLAVISIFISFISILLSIIAIVMSYNIKDSSFTYVEILTTLFSFIVSILIAWQIWTSINLKSIVYDNIEESKHELEKKVETLGFELKKDVINSLMASLYKTEGIRLQLNATSGYLDISVEILQAMYDYAICLDDNVILNDYAEKLYNTIVIFKNRLDDNIKEKNILIDLSDSVLSKLHASDYIADKLNRVNKDLKAK